MIVITILEPRNDAPEISTFCTIIMPYVLAVGSLEPFSLEKLLDLP